MSLTTSRFWSSVIVDLSNARGTVGFEIVAVRMRGPFGVAVHDKTIGGQFVIWCPDVRTYINTRKAHVTVLILDSKGVHNVIQMGACLPQR